MVGPDRVEVAVVERNYMGSPEPLRERHHGGGVAPSAKRA
jgi:hypothetical protein